MQKADILHRTDLRDSGPQDLDRPISSLWPIMPAAAVIYCFLLFPVEAGLSLGETFLPIYRIGLLATLPFLMTLISKGHLRWATPDLFVLLTSFWMILSFIIIYDVVEGIVRSAALVIDFAVAYCVARCAISQPNDLRRLLIILLPGLVLVAVVMALESVGGRILYRPFFASVFGNASLNEGGAVVGSLGFRPLMRLGLLRAGGPFSHPILAGTFLLSFLPMWWVSRIRLGPRVAGCIAALAGLFSISSAAILGAILGVLFLSIDFFKRWLPQVGWPFIVAIAAGGIIALELVSENGAAAIIARNTLDPQTAFYRLLIWEYGSATVAANPWVGIGYAVYDKPDWMTSSVDAHFLNIAIRNGLPAAVFMLLGTIVAMVKLGQASSFMREIDRDLAVSVNISLAVMLLLAFTVAFFGEAGIWYSMLTGIAASLSISVDKGGIGAIA